MFFFFRPAVCEKDGAWPETLHGYVWFCYLQLNFVFIFRQIALVQCKSNTERVMKRLCSDGKWSEINEEQCSMLQITNLSKICVLDCKDYENWVDGRGGDCTSFYRAQGFCFRGQVENPWLFLPYIKKRADKNKVDASQACCICGGGFVPIATLNTANSENKIGI